MYDLLCTTFSFIAVIGAGMLKLVSYLWGHNAANEATKAEKP